MPETRQSFTTTVLHICMRKKSFLLLAAGVSLALFTQTAFAIDASVNGSKKNRKEKKEKKQVDTLKPWEVDTLIRPVPINRQLFVDRVHKAIRRLDARDGSVDQKIDLADTLTGRILTDVIFKRVPATDIHIENLEVDNQTKIGYHRALENMLNRFAAKSFSNGDLTYFKNAARNFEEMLIALQDGSIEQFAHKNANIYTLDNSELLNDYPEDKAYVFETVGTELPAIMIKRLPEFAKEKYADPIVAAAARVVPGTILNYATSTSYLSSVVRRNQDPLVQTIVKIGSISRDPLKALPFLGPIYHENMTIAQVDEAARSNISYYKALVAAELLNDSIGKAPLDKEVNYRGLQLVRVVNSLHERPNPVRFASIMGYDAPELYFMIIGSQDEIYTSSFVFMANRLLEKMKPEAGDAFLKRIHFYRFRTWIRMCAGYNMLSPFLATMTEQDKGNLMKEFVAGLEKGGPNDLEDAVDVADAFGSITDQKLMDFLEKEVIKNYEKCKDNEKGTIVYGLLSTIMSNSKNSKELTGKLSIIPPITYVPYNQLVDSNQSVIIQAFFYGDPDGHMSFNSFHSNFPAAQWTKTSNKYWIHYSYKGKYPVDVYANYPGDEEKNEDIAAQKQLQAYFTQKDIHPTIVIHRGHSYHLNGSLKNLDPEVKVVMLGSCGGYHNLAKVLDKSPDANIISTKQTGAMSVNEPIIKELLKQLTKGEDIDWIQSWEDLAQFFSKRSAHERDLFSDYVPPNENLGAIFIKAYRKMQQTSESL